MQTNFNKLKELQEKIHNEESLQKGEPRLEPESDNFVKCQNPYNVIPKEPIFLVPKANWDCKYFTSRQTVELIITALKNRAFNVPNIKVTLSTTKYNGGKPFGGEYIPSKIWRYVNYITWQYDDDTTVKLWFCEIVGSLVSGILNDVSGLKEIKINGKETCDWEYLPKLLDHIMKTPPVDYKISLADVLIPASDNVKSMKLYSCKTATFDSSDPFEKGEMDGWWRMCNLFNRDDDTFNNIAYDGCNYLSFHDKERDSEEKRSRQKVRLKYSNGIYVVDYTPYLEYRSDCFKRTNYLSDEEVNEADRCLARTLVPIEEYDGSYKEPSVVIFRQLFRCEVLEDGKNEFDETEEISDSMQKVESTKSL